MSKLSLQKSQVCNQKTWFCKLEKRRKPLRENVFCLLQRQVCRICVWAGPAGPPHHERTKHERAKGDTEPPACAQSANWFAFDADTHARQRIPTDDVHTIRPSCKMLCIALSPGLGPRDAAKKLSHNVARRVMAHVVSWDPSTYRQTRRTRDIGPQHPRTIWHFLLLRTPSPLE